MVKVKFKLKIKVKVKLEVYNKVMVIVLGTQIRFPGNLVKIR